VLKTSDPPPVLGTLAQEGDRARLEEWLAVFPRQDAETCRGLLGAGQPVWVVEPDVELAHFRMHPGACLRKVLKTLRHVSVSAPETHHVLWCLENWDNRGLEDFEAEVVFGTWLDIMLLSQVERGGARSRILVVGRLRDESIGISFRVASLAGPSHSLTTLGLEILGRSALPVAALFVGHEEAAFLTRNPRDSVARRLRWLLNKKACSLGLWVSAPRTRYALDDLQAELGPLLSLADGESTIRHVRFEEASALNPPDRLARAMRRAKLSFDSSLSSLPRDESSDGVRRLNGPYFRAGAYQPQSFDLRTPAGAWKKDGFIEIVAAPMDRFGSDWTKLWRWRQGHDLARIARLLDFRRMEAYFREYEKLTHLAQSYHEYRIYNWPTPDRSPRCTFVDCGPLDDPLTVWRVTRRAQRMTRRPGLRLYLKDSADLLADAELEARMRLEASEKSILAAQVKAHGYLRTIPPQGPLRQDLEDFVAFLPPTLGRALELGSGYGQLARVLCPRSERYYCVDLDAGMFAGLREDARQYGVVADIHCLPFASQSFDTVLANNVLEHTYDPLQCLREVCRVLRPGGHLYALIPLDALNTEYSLRSHLWKADEEGIYNALRMANLEPARCEVIDLYALGIKGAFPSCNGLVCKLAARRPASGKG
jgi:SAM-dependent methyltransferase